MTNSNQKNFNPQFSSSFKNNWLQGFGKKINNFLLKIKSELSLYDHKKIRLSLIQSVNNDVNGVEKKVLVHMIEKGKSVAGYVPFVPKKTDIVFYNFFSINYGFRTKGKVVFVLVDENFKPKYTLSKDVNPREIVSLPRDLPTNANESKFCVVLYLHSSINPNHGNHGGHLRFWGAWDNFSAFTHSMPLPNSKFYFSFVENLRKIFSKTEKNKLMFDRRFYPSEARSITHCSPYDGYNKIMGRGDLSPDLNYRMGFSVLGLGDEQISACFHDSPYTREQIVDNISTSHVVALPNIPSVDAFLYFGECCKPGTRFLARLFNANQERVPVAEITFEVKNLDPIRLSSIFKDQELIGVVPSWLVLTSISGQNRNYYVNIIYSDKASFKMFDGVHSHCFSSSLAGRSLKFAPFKLNSPIMAIDGRDPFVKSSLVIFGHVVNDTNYRVRVFFDADSNLEVVESGLILASTVKFIDLNLILKSQPKASGYYVVQLESEEHNLNASLYCWSSYDGSLIRSVCVDHLTGG